MSREIKFRAWDKALNMMIYSKEQIGHIEYDTNPVDVINIMLNEDDYGLEFMEYTGLNDRVNDEKIYDKDIIKALNRRYDNEDNWRDYFETFEVTYLNGCWMFGNWNAHEFFNKFIYIEVIGNKFEGVKEDK